MIFQFISINPKRQVERFQHSIHTTNHTNLEDKEEIVLECITISCQHNTYSINIVECRVGGSVLLDIPVVICKFVNIRKLYKWKLSVILYKKGDYRNGILRALRFFLVSENSIAQDASLLLHFVPPTKTPFGPLAFFYTFTIRSTPLSAPAPAP